MRLFFLQQHRATTAGSNRYPKPSQRYALSSNQSHSHSQHGFSTTTSSSSPHHFHKPRPLYTSSTTVHAGGASIPLQDVSEEEKAIFAPTTSTVTASASSDRKKALPLVRSKSSSSSSRGSDESQSRILQKSGEGQVLVTREYQVREVEMPSSPPGTRGRGDGDVEIGRAVW